MVLGRREWRDWVGAKGSRRERCEVTRVICAAVKSHSVKTCQ